MQVTSKVAAIFVASLLVSSVTAAGPAGQISEYSCDDTCQGCKKAIQKYDLTATNSAASGKLNKVASGAVSDATGLAYCVQGTQATPVTVFTKIYECTPTSSTAGNNLWNEASPWAVIVDHYTTKGCATASEAHRNTYVAQQCYTGSTVGGGWGGVAKTTITSFKWARSAADDWRRTDYTDTTCNTAGVYSSTDSDIQDGQTAKSVNAACDARDQYMKYIKELSPAVMRTYTVVAAGDANTPTACTDGATNLLAGLDGVAGTAGDNKAKLRMGSGTLNVNAFDGTSFAIAGSTWDTSRQSIISVTDELPRGVCVGAKGAKKVVICPTSTTTPASSADSSADSTAAATTTAAAVTTTAAAATTTAAASSASAVSAIAAFAAAVLCVVA